MARLIHKNGSVDLAARTFYMLVDGTSVVQERGVSQKDVMSQNAVTSELQEHDTKIIDLQQQKLNKSEAYDRFLTILDASVIYATKDEIPEFPELDLSQYPTFDDLKTKLSEFENDADFVTMSAVQGRFYDMEQVDARLDAIKANNEAILYNYYNKEEVDYLLKQNNEDTENSHKDINDKLNSLDNSVSDINSSLNELYQADSTLSDRVTEIENKDVVEFSKYPDEPDRKAIVLKNHDTLSGTMTDGDGANLVMLSKWNVADFGSTKVHLNLNSNDRPTINDSSVIAVLEDIANSDKLLSEKLEEFNSSVNYKFEEISDKHNEDIENINSSISDISSRVNSLEEIDHSVFLTEHQSLEEYAKTEYVDEKYSELKATDEEHELKDEELENRLEIVEELSATFIKFNNWEEGYYLSDDYGLNQGVQQHDMCYHQIIDVSGCKPIDFYFHYAPTDKNFYIFEYSGQPSLATYIKKTEKKYWDLTLTLSSNTKYIVVNALMPEIPYGQYYVRGIKKDDENGHVTYEEFNNALSELEQKITDSSLDIDLSDYATKEFVDSAIKNVTGYDDTELKDRLSVLEEIDHEKYALKNDIPTDYLTADDISAFARVDYVDNQVEEKFNAILDEAPEKFDTFKEVADYIEKHEEVSKAIQQAITDKADRTELKDYATQAYVDSVFNSVEETYLTDIQNRIGELEKIDYEEFAKKSEIPTDYLTEKDLDEYAKKSDLPDLDEYAKTEDLAEYARTTDLSIYLTDDKLTGYATQEYVQNEIQKIEFPEFDSSSIESRLDKLEQIDHNLYATKEKVDSSLTEIEQKITDVSNSIDNIDLSDYAKVEDLSVFALKEDLPDEYDDTELKNRLTALEEIDHNQYATQSYVNSEITNLRFNDLQMLQMQVSQLSSQIQEINGTLEGVDEMLNDILYTDV